MPEGEHPTARYQRLARQCLEVANTFGPGEQRTALLHMAEVWQRLANDYEQSTAALFQPNAGEPAMQQQQQIQPENDKKD
jgi:hypothetical protein